MVVAVFRTIFAQADPEAVSKARDEVRDQLTTSFPKIGPLMDEVLEFTAFPNAAAVIRLVGAVLIDMHDEWIAGERRYPSEESMALLNTTMDIEDHAAIESDE